MSETAELLTPAHNYAVVQLPGRNFPGVVFQGDSLFSLLQRLARVREQLSGGDVSEAEEEIEFIESDLNAVLTSYRSVCEKYGQKLPFSDSLK